MTVRTCTCGHPEGDHNSNRSNTNPRHGVCLIDGCECREFKLASDYLLLMRGDRLHPEIQHGDHLTVRETRTAEPGQLVVAMVRGGARIERYEPGMEVIGLVLTVMRRVPGAGEVVT